LGVTYQVASIKNSNKSPSPAVCRQGRAAEGARDAVFPLSLAKYYIYGNISASPLLALAAMRSTAPAPADTAHKHHAAAVARTKEPIPDRSLAQA
jgi:hypothetical protein